MVTRSTPGLAAKLIAQGLPPDTPALLAESVSRPDQKLTRHSVASLAEALARETGDKAGLIFFGPLAEE